MRHSAVRVWWKPWRRRCRCGCRWYPCPDSVTMNRPPITLSLRLNEGPAWNGPTLRNMPPLMTRGQQWRSRLGRR